MLFHARSWREILRAQDEQLTVPNSGQARRCLSMKVDQTENQLWRWARPIVKAGVAWKESERFDRDPVAP